MEIRLRGLLVDGKDGIDDVRVELRGEAHVELRGERRSCHVEEEFPIDVTGKLELVQELARVGGGES